MADQITTNPNAARDVNGEIVPAARMFTYLTGTTTPVVVFQDVAGTIPHATPILADINGVFPQVFYTGVIKVVVTDPDGVVLPGYPLDPAPRTSVGTSGASTISFLPIEGLEETNVQAAIEALALRTGNTRNLIINGSGRINQRGYVSGTATSGANQFTLDRWFVVVSGQNLTFTGDDSRREMTAPAGGVRQVIEALNILGGTYVMNWTGTATATVNGVARTKGETFTLPANTNVIVAFTNGTFSDVQLERGTVVTPFEWRSIGQELALSQRYYQRLNLSQRFYADTGGRISGSSLPFFVPMAANPAQAVVAGGRANVSSVNHFSTSTGGRIEITSAAAGDAFALEDTLVLTSELTS